VKAGAVATFCVDPRAAPPPENSPSYGLIGLAAFRNERITLDYVAGKFIVEPAEPLP
jgi:hypothetical protein